MRKQKEGFYTRLLMEVQFIKLLVHYVAPYYVAGRFGHASFLQFITIKTNRVTNLKMFSPKTCSKIPINISPCIFYKHRTYLPVHFLQKDRT